MIDYNIETDFYSVTKQFKAMGKDVSKMRKLITSKILGEVRKETRRNIRKNLKQKSKRLARNTHYWAFPDGTGRLILGKYYGKILEGGMTVAPKQKEFLRFKIGDKWIKTKKSIYIPPKDIARSAWARGTTPQKMNELANQILEKEFKKWKAK